MHFTFSLTLRSYKLTLIVQIYQIPCVQKHQYKSSNSTLIGLGVRSEKFAHDRISVPCSMRKLFDWTL